MNMSRLRPRGFHKILTNLNLGNSTDREIVEQATPQNDPLYNMVSIYLSTVSLGGQGFRGRFKFFVCYSGE